MVFLELLALGVLVAIGLVVILAIGAFLFLLPALVVAFVVWLISGSQLLAGVAFLLIALLSIAKR